MISSSKPIDRITLLLQSGLAGPDLTKLAYYRIIMQNPEQGIFNMVYRNYTVTIFDKLVNYVLNDMVMYNRLRQLLLADHPNIREDAFEALILKAEKSNIPVEVIIEVYNRGYEQTYPINLTKEQRAFNRVNSFIAGGLAREQDADLFEMEVEPEDRELGTDSLRQSFQRDTPGQNLTTSTIKKLIRNKNV